MRHRIVIYIWFSAVALLVWAGMGVAGPDLEVIPQKYSARPGEVFPVEYTFTWQDAGSPYTVLPPALPSLDWGEAALLEVRAQSAGDVNKTRVIVGFTAAETGHHEVPAIEFRLMNWNTEDNTAVLTITPETPAQLLTSTPLTIKVSAVGIPVIVAAIAVLLTVIVVGVAAWRFKRGTAPDTGAMSLSVTEQGAALLHEARRHRLDGDYYAFYRVLRRAYDLVARVSGTPDERLCARLDVRIKDTGYRGLRPTEDDLEGDFKEVEQQVARMNDRAPKES